MIKIAWGRVFGTSYKKRVKSDDELKKRFWDIMETFSRNPFTPFLLTRKLTGKLEGLQAISVTNDYRVIFKSLDKYEVLLIDIGGDDEVY